MSDVRVIRGDWRDVLPTLPEAGEIACVITDPPYGIGFVRGSGGSGPKGQRKMVTPRVGSRPIAGDNKPFDPSSFLGWPCVFFGANHFAARLPEGGSWHVWDKRAYSTLEDSFADVEFIWTSTKTKSEIIEHLWKGVLQASEKGKPKYHVSQKPVRIMAHLIQKYTKPGDLILDPFTGSGSTLVAAMKTGRRAIGIEIDEAYVRIAERRIAEAETPLFNATA